MTERVGQGATGRPARTVQAHGGAGALPGPSRGLGDNSPLSVKPRSAGASSVAPRRAFDPDTEPPELSAMVGRVLRSLVRRAEAGDIAALAELEVIDRAVMEASQAAARGLIAGPGRYSWGEVGRELGVTRQAARQRFSRRLPGDDDR